MVFSPSSYLTNFLLHKRRLMRLLAHDDQLGTRIEKCLVGVVDYAISSSFAYCFNRGTVLIEMSFGRLCSVS